MNRTENILKYITNECDQITKYFDKTERNDISFFCLSMLDRLNFSSHSLTVLLNTIDVNTKVEYSCGIIIRSVLLDYMILLNSADIYLKQPYSNENIKNLKQFCSEMLADSINHTISNIEIVYAHLTKEELSKLYNNIIDLNPDLFETYSNDGTKPKLLKYKPIKSPKKIYEIIRQGMFKSEKGVYEAYLYYSKYDHFGQMFYELSRQEFMKRINQMNKSIHYYFLHYLLYSIVILTSIHSSDIFLNTKREQVVAYIESLHSN